MPAETWQQTDGPTSNRIYSLAIASTSQTIFAGTDSGLYKSTVGSGSWTAVDVGFPAGYVSTVVIDPTDSQVVYAGAMYGVFKSTDGGVTWTTLANTLLSMTIQGVVDSIALDPSNTQIIYVGTNSGGVFKSTDGGSTWCTMNNGLPNIPTVQVLVIDPIDTQVVYAGLYGGGIPGAGGVFKTTDGGGSWSSASNGLPVDVASNYYSVPSLAIDPSNHQTLYAATNRGVYKSTNGGGTWYASSSDNHTYVVPFGSQSVIMNPVNTQTIYAGTSFLGIFKSTDGGGTWDKVSTTTSPPAFWSFAIDSTAPRTIYAGTEDGKIFKRLLSN